MNKRLLTLSMVGLLTMTVTSCDVTQKEVDGKQVIVTVGDKEYTADDLLAKYSTTADGVTAYYNAIYDVLIRDQQEITEDMKTTVSTEIDNFTKEVKRNASSNGVTYKTELSDELEEKGVETLAELAEIYTLDEQKTKYEEDWYSSRIDWEDNKDELTQKYIESSTPYHIKHILVKTSSAGTSLYKGTISEDEALKLSSVAKRLASGTESFGQVAQQASDDTTSAAVYGSIGIVDQDSNSSYVSEFKYGCYVYDAYFDQHTDNEAKTSEQRVAALNIPTSISYNKVSSGTTTIDVEKDVKSIAEIPYTVIENLETYADKTKTENNLTYVPKVSDTSYWTGSESPKNIDSLAGQTIDENYYPRNIIFNNYFNDHGLYVITDEGYTGSDTSRFVQYDQICEEHKILCDEKGNPILVTRAGSGDSYQGVHFMVIEQSPFWYDSSKLEYATPLTDTMEEGKTPTTSEYLRYYYSTNIPSTSSEDVTNNQKYVTFVKSNRTTYSDRADKIEEAVKSYDSNISYSIFDTLYEGAKDRISINNDVLTSINNMIAEKKASSAYTKEQDNIASWKSYAELLELQDEEKEVKQLDLEFIKMYDKNYSVTPVHSNQLKLSK